jgi:uncharacterized protein
MKEYSDGTNYILRFDRGEEVITRFSDWIKQREIKAATLTGLGAVEHPHLGYYDAQKRDYVNKEFEGEYEIASMCGNISRDGSNGEPIIHAHAVISGPNFIAFGGHFYSAVVSGTVEISVIPFDAEIVRTYCEELNLKLLD